MSTTESLVQYAATCTYDDLPDQTVEDVKIHVLDTLGAIIAGSIAEGSINLNRRVSQWGGRQESTILGYGGRVPAPNAALVNSVMSRGFDFETILSGGATHVSASVIPAALALAEYREAAGGLPVGGKDLLAAIAVGTDLNWRFRVAGGPSTILAGGWLAETFAPPAIAAMGGKLLGFAPERLNYAMAIGYNHCCGTYGTTVGDNGGPMAQLSQGLGAKSGVMSALFAEIGVTAYKDVIDGRWGLYRMYGDGSYDADVLTGGLGKRFDALSPGVKKYPGCGATQPVVSSTLKLVGAHRLTGEDIDSVEITVGESSYRLCGENKWAPGNTADALWNYRYSTAVALAKGKVFVDDFTKGAIGDRRVLDLIPKIHVQPDPSLKHGVRVVIQTVAGKTLAGALDDMESVEKGEVLEKFRKCCRFSAKPLSDEKVEAFIRAVEHLEDVKSVGELVACLV